MIPGPPSIQRLGRNYGRYDGERIDIAHVLREIHQLALDQGWESDPFFDSGGVTLRAYRRPHPGAERNLYISTGIHGDEPSGPLAVRRLLEENHWPRANLWLVPCLNPLGYDRNTRENDAGIDLNRDYRDPRTPEISAHVRWLEQQPNFDLTLLLHEDWEANGFYVYELNPENLRSLAEGIVAQVRGLCPIEPAEQVDGWACRDGIIRPQVPPAGRPQWAEALYLSVHKTPLSYTLETPSDFPLALRVETHTRAVKEALRHF